ncbi:MAG TPA: photosynthetic reaction center cytochrome c subunit family protein [Bacteroidota bacterium]
MKGLYLSLGLLILPLGAPAQNTPQQPERDKNLVALEQAIKGKENLPAEQVFKNIELFKGMPAVRVLRVMEFAFTTALGVNCTHCHVEQQWESDEKRPKQVARKMWTMQRELTQQLKTITEKNDAVVNCTTCHRGDTKPALNLPLQRKTGN